MKKTSLNKWVIAVPVIALIVFSIYYASNNKQDNAVNENSDEKIAAALLEEAIRQNVSVSEKDVNNTINALRMRANMSEQQYNEFILTSYPNLGEFRAKITDNLKILKLIDENVDFSGINVTDADVDRYVDENKAIMPIEQIETDPKFKEEFYRLAKQQLIQNMQQQLVREYVSEVLEKSG
ncbi:hypothetical protein KY347_03680 [Candidatus Woesearchaeota archaeon]|nr:hypothetical protein [Candidatus Woesearchaeota archaeon]